MKSFCIKTLGCKVNQCEADDVRQRLLEFGLSESRDFLTADIRIINTCCVTGRAERKSRQLIRQAARCEGRPDGCVVVTGCYPGYERKWIEKTEGIDKVFGQKEKRQFFSWLKTFESRRKTRVVLPAGHGGRTRAFLKIQDGCDNRCSYCVVPLMRGPSTSLGSAHVLAHARVLAESGRKEIVLTGVNIGSFGKKRAGVKQPLVHLIRALEKVEGLERIRLSSIEAGDVSEDLIRLMAVSDKLCPHLHIPFQSGDDQVLAAMNRRLRAADYLRLVDEARKAVRNLAVTCDMIVGFPVEEERQFRQTLSFVRQVRPLKVHVFPFSLRRGTAAASAYKPLAPGVVKERADVLRTVASEVAQGLLQERVGSLVDVLCEQREEGWWTGHSAEYFKVYVDSREHLHNQIRRVRVLGLRKEGVFGGFAGEDRGLLPALGGPATLS